MENFNELKETLLALEEDVNKFYNKKNKAAGDRIRKAMQQVKSIAQIIRLDISAKNKENKEAKK